MGPGVSPHPSYPLPLLGSQRLGNFPNPSLSQCRPPPTQKRRPRKHPIREFGRKVCAISMVFQVVLMFSEIHFFSLFKVPSIQSFHHWLTGPDNDKGHCTATLHAKQLLLVWRKVSPTLTIEDLFNLEELKEKWLRPLLHSFSPGTVQSNCGSVALFLEFTICKGLTGQRGDAAAALAEYRHMSKSLRRRCLRRQTEVEAESLRKIFNICNVLFLFIVF